MRRFRPVVCNERHLCAHLQMRQTFRMAFEPEAKNDACGTGCHHKCFFFLQ